MTTHKVGYLIGSLAKGSINRKLARALVRLAPPELVMSEISFRDLPLYSYDYDADFPAAAKAFELMREGLSLADIIGITKQQRDALLAQGGRLLQLGEIGKARDVFLQLYRLEYTDERAIYGLATTYQLEGDFATAAKLYVMFMAYDATNPEGHLRLAECLLGAKEYEKAEAFFIVARDFAKHAGDAACERHHVVVATGSPAVPERAEANRHRARDVLRAAAVAESGVLGVAVVRREVVGAVEVQAEIGVMQREHRCAVRQHQWIVGDTRQ